jgi:hypothetical protein
MFRSEFGPGLDHPRSLSDDQSSASSNTAEKHYSGLVIKTLPASYHRPELDLTKEIVAFKASDTEQATSRSRDRFEGGPGSLLGSPGPGHLS